MAIQRIATVVATGDRYLVQRMSIRAPKQENLVHCWGEVVSYKTGLGHTHAERLATGASTKHAESKTFTASAVTITEENVTGALAETLLKQATRNLKNVRGTQSRTVRK